MAVGSPKTDKFAIGTSEIRVGALASAAKLTGANSMGLVDSTTVSVTQESVDLEGGLPKRTVATAIVRQATEVSAVLREYSRRNINLMLGNGVVADPAAFATTLTAQAAAAATTLAMTSVTGIVAGDLLIGYNEGRPEDVQILKIASIAALNVTLEATTPVLITLNSGAPILLASPVAIGAVTKTSYFSTMVVGQEFSTGAPTVWNFWKCAISTGMEYANNSDDFASTTLTIKALEPSAADIAVGGPLEDQAAEIALYPVGLARI